MDIVRLERGLDKYQKIMERFHTVNVSSDDIFQRTFKNFYKMYRRTPEFYCCYFNYMEQQKENKTLTFKEVLEYIYENTGRVEASFSSKLLATVNPEMPIWDKYVLRNLGLKAPSYGTRDRIQRVVDLYDEIYKWYQSNKDADEYAKQFDELFPDPNVNITQTKKTDFILWQMRNDN